jgi:dTDP-4-dehydrorhamnose reductase
MVVSANKKMRIAITGANGMLGTDLIKILSVEHEIIAICRSNVHKDVLNKIKGQKTVDITDKKIIDVITDISPELIIHCAAFTDVDKCELEIDKAYKVNAIGTQYVALACQKLSIPCVYISTDFVFNGAKNMPYTEYDLPSPINVYGASKLCGEFNIRSLLNKFYIIRTSWTYGKYGKNFVNTILKLTETENELKVVKDQIGTPTYTVDLAKEISRLIKTGLYGTYNIANTGVCSRYEQAMKILEIKKINKWIIPISSLEYKKPALRPAYSTLRNYCLELTIGNKMRSWDNALEEFLCS